MRHTPAQIHAQQGNTTIETAIRAVTSPPTQIARAVVQVCRESGSIGNVSRDTAKCRALQYFI